MFFSFVLWIIFFYVVYYWLTMKPKNFPPGPPHVPVLGSSFYLLRKHLHIPMAGEWLQKYGPVVGFVAASRKIIAICGPREVLEVLHREEFQARPMSNFFRDRSFGKKLGVFFSDGPYWVEQRRFTLRHLRDFGFGKRSMEEFIMEEIQDTIKEITQTEIMQAKENVKCPPESERHTASCDQARKKGVQPHYHWSTQKMPFGKNLKLVKGQQHRRRAKCQAVGGGSSSSQPKLQPRMVLLRHLYFLNPEHTKYVSVGFYPDRDYQACVEFVAARKEPAVLTPSLLATLSFHLPKQGPYRCNELSFCLQTVTGVEAAAKMSMDRRSITVKVGELNYLLLNLPTLVHQLKRYRIAEKDVG